MKHLKKLKKLVAFAVSAVMCIGMTVPAFAAGSDVTYDVYQIFTGNYGILDETDKSLGNLRWGENGTGAAGDAVDGTTLDTLEAAKSLGDEGQRVRAVEQFVDFGSIPYKTVDAVFGEEVVVDDVVPGYYLIRQNDASDGEVVPTYTVQVTGTRLQFKPKVSTVPTVEKKVNGVDKSAAAVGDVLNFEITGTLPGNLSAYHGYYYTFTDVLSKGLTLGDDVKVMLGDQDVTSKFYVGSVKDDETGETVLTVGTWLLNTDALEEASAEVAETYLVDLKASDVFKVIYTAVINEDANMGKDPNTNTVSLAYSNDPGHSDFPKDWTPDDKPEPGPATGDTVIGDAGRTETYVTGLTLTYFKGKTQEDRDNLANRLAGSQFKLSGSGLNTVVDVTVGFVPDGEGEYWAMKNGTYTKVGPVDSTEDQYASTVDKYSLSVETVAADGEPIKEISAVTNDEGQIIFKGLGVGEYTLSQVLTPSGYTTAADIDFSIAFDDENLFSTPDAEKGVREGTDEEWFYIDLSATSGVLLPETGGMGVYVLYAGGAVLVAIAGALLFLKNRKKGSAE